MRMKVKSSMAREVNRGFTLVECLLAITLFSILITSVYSVFRAGVRAERSGEALTEQIRRVRWVMNDMSREVRNIITEPGGYFEGGEDNLSFLTLLSIDDDDSRATSQLYQVIYLTESDGMADLTTLVRISRKLDDEKADTTTVHGVIRDIDFAYQAVDDDGNKTWVTSWEDDGAPGSIRVEIVAGDSEYSTEDLRITQIIPIMTDREIGTDGG
jgi:prepilin-type N-terminal cleavage/methylation domain-containing protein